MPATDPVLPPAADIGELLHQAAATAYCLPALRALGGALPADDALVIGALREAADRRAAQSFSHVYLAALLAGRRIPAAVLETGAALLPQAVLLLHTALQLEGDVAEPLAAAVRAGRMGNEREATALIAGWLDYERRGIPAPPEFLALTRRLCRVAMRADLQFVRALMSLAAKLSGDPVLAAILDIEPAPAMDRVVAETRKSATDGRIWRNLIPGSPVVAETTLGGGATVKRALPKAGRNDPCPCGSGRKFKQCCEGKLRTGDQYEVEGVTASEAAAHPELRLTPRRIRQMRVYEVHALNPGLLTPELAGEVAVQLACFREIPRAIEVLQAFEPDQLSINALDEIAYEFHQARDATALRWLVNWAPESIHLSFDMEILLASPAERLQMLVAKAREAFEAERSGARGVSVMFCDIGHAALVVDPALGILIARGVMPVSGCVNQLSLMDDIEDARDLLGLDNDEPAHEFLDAADQASRDQARRAGDVEKIRAETTARVTQRDAEIHRLKAQIDAMQETLKQRELASAKISATPKQPSAPAATPAHDNAETRELRERLHRLKDHLKLEHDERNRALRDLRAAQDQLRRATREKPENPPPDKPADPADDGEDSTTASAVDWERQPLRIPEYAAAFKDALRKHPRLAAAAALAAAGRLAGGDPAIWKTVRALKLRPGTLRVRVAGDYRLLFETGPGETLRLLDCILRRDLDRWLASSAR